jgi:hypothetical protein
MNSKDGPLILILLFLITVVLSALFYIVDNPEVLGNQIAKDENPQEVILTQNTLGESDVIEEEIRVYPSLNICYEDDCYYIPPEIVETFYNTEKVDKTKLYMYLLEYVVSYFEEASGGKVWYESKNGGFYAWEDDLRIDTSNVYEGVENLLLHRGEYQLDLRYDLYKKDLPGTDGKYADKYIEIDNSKQKLYDWENGEVVKEIKLSAAKKGYEVYGVYPIIDKGVEPRAPSLRYMPYWMAFYYSPWQKSWYGLHGLVWWYDDNGNIIYENTDYIGVRRSAGCIRMLKDDAKYLYDRYDRGDHILIHE